MVYIGVIRSRTWKMSIREDVGREAFIPGSVLTHLLPLLGRRLVVQEELSSGNAKSKLQQRP